MMLSDIFLRILFLKENLKKSAIDGISNKEYDGSNEREYHKLSISMSGRTENA